MVNFLRFLKTEYMVRKMSISIWSSLKKYIYQFFYKYKYNKVKEKVVRYKKGRKTIYIIRIDFPMAGLFAIAKSVLCHIEYSISKGWIPIVDLCNSCNQFNTGKKDNPWEIFFEQPLNLGLEDISKSDNLVISTKLQSPNKDYQLTVDLLLPENENQLNVQSVFYNKYIRLSKTVKDYVECKTKELIGDKQNVLGVLCRGTDYIEKKPKYHPIQPDPAEVISKIRDIQNKMNINYIYLATEDSLILEQFESEFGDKLLFINQKRLSHTKDSFISDIKISREEKIRMNLDYIVSMNILSRCDYLIGGRTSGTIAACLMNNSHKYKYLWDLGLY